MTAASAQKATPEQLLREHGNALDRHRAGRSAIWIYLSRLGPSAHHRENASFAADVFARLMRAHDGRAYELTSGDVVLILKDAPPGELEQKLFELHHRFTEAPVVRAQDDAGLVVTSQGPGPRFSALFRMENDYAAFRAEVMRAVHGEPDPFDDPDLHLSDTRISGAQAAARAADAERPDFSSLIAQTVIARIQGDGTVMRRFRRIAMREELRAQLLDRAQRDLIAPEITRELEARIDAGYLELLAPLLERQGIVTFVDMSVSGLMSPEFLLLNDALEKAGVPRPVLSVRRSEIMSHTNDFAYIARFAIERKYGFALHEDETELWRPQNVGKVFQYALRSWNFERARAASDDAPKLQANAGPAEAILIDCTDRDGLNYARTARFTYASGSYVEALSTSPGSSGSR